MDIRTDIFNRTVIIAEKREKKPSEFKNELKICPFCNLKEPILWKDKETETFIIKNKYPTTEESYVIVHEKHNASLESKKLLLGFGKAINHLAKKNKGKYMLIFKNNGPLSGASLSHAHEQIIFVNEPFFNEKKLKNFINKELNSERYIAPILSPYAPIRPYELWVIFDSKDIKTFNENEMLKLIPAYKFQKQKLKAFDYNVIIIYSPKKLFPIFAILLPRKEVFGGVEYLTRISVNGVPPEKVAAELKKYEFKL